MKATLHKRLSGLRVDVPTEVAARHAAEISAELMHPGPVTPPRRLRRRWVLPVVVAAALLIPAAAFAAESTTPGDLLYPVKRTTEWVRSIVDSTINAEHRVDELEIVIERRAPINVVSDRLADAEQSVEQSDGPRRLADRIDDARDQIERHYGVHPRDIDSVNQDRSSQDRNREPSDTAANPSSTTTEPPHDEGPRDPPTMTTTEPPRERGDRDN